MSAGQAGSTTTHILIETDLLEIHRVAPLPVVKDVIGGNVEACRDDIRYSILRWEPHVQLRSDAAGASRPYANIFFRARGHSQLPEAARSRSRSYTTSPGNTGKSEPTARRTSRRIACQLPDSGD